MSAGAVTVRLNLASGGYSAEMAKAERQMRQLKKAGEDFGHSMPSQMQAASGALRLLEGNFENNIRAAERLLGMIGPLSALLQTAFPVVGGIALIGVLVEATQRATALISKLNDIPDNPFKGIISSSKLSNDALAITNDRLENEIAKLEHKPQNRMAEALDEMKNASDRLFDSLDKSNRAFDEAAAKGGVSKSQGLWRNETPTDAADAAIKRARSGVQSVRDDHQSTIDDALASRDPENIKQSREALMVDLQKAYVVQDEALRAGLDKAATAAKDFHGSFSVGSDPRAVIQRYQSALTVSSQDQQSIGGQYGNSLLTGRKDKDQDSSDAAELQREADRKRLKAMEEELQNREGEYGKSILVERSYWQARESAFKTGSDAYREVVGKVAALEIQMARQQSESLKAARGSQASDSRESFRVLESSSAAVSALMKRQAEDVFHTGERWKAYNEAVAKASEIQAANAAAFNETRIAIELASGQISKLDAAEQLADVHTKKFTSDLAVLQKQRQQILADGDLTDAQRDTALKQNDNSQTALNGQYQTQNANDKSAIADQQLGPATRKALDTMVQDWGDMTKGIVATMTKAIDSFNDDLTKLISGHGSKADFGKTLTDAGEGLTKTALQKVESGLLGAAGLGKPDGSKGNPYHTVDDGQGGLGGLGSIFGGGGGGDDSGGGGGGIFGMFKSLFGGGGGALSDGGGISSVLGSLGGIFQGFFAEGGNFVANRPMLVGERGPEIIRPGRAGHVVPNHQLGGTVTNHHYNIDARGATDPSAVEAAVRRAAPHIIAASMQAHHARSKRMPHGR